MWSVEEYTVWAQVHESSNRKVYMEMLAAALKREQKDAKSHPQPAKPKPKKGSQ